MDRERAALAAIGTLAVSNVATNRVLPDAAYVPWQLTLGAGLVTLARRAGCTDADLGLDRRDLRHGVTLGAGLAAGIAALHAGVWASGRARDAFRDRRVTDLTPTAAGFQALVRIPLGTALVEEVAFRSVLPALLASPRRPGWWPAAVSSALFGLWHVLPSQHLVGANEGVGRLSARTRVGVPALAVGATTVAGATLHELRRRGRHLATPVLVHLAANVSGFVVARATAR